MFCSKCGNPLPAGTTFCQNCGTPVSASPGASALPSPASSAYAAPAPAGAVSPHWLPTPTRTYAGFWLRLVAHLVDGILIGVVMMALLIPLAVMTGVGAGLRRFHPNDPPDPAMVMAFIGSLWLLILVAVIGGWLYNAYCESSEWQATPGKKILNLVVTDLNGNRVTFGRASGRFFAKMISGIIPFGIGYIMAGFTERKQALHDMIASCLVLRA
ncbi:MAG TPA: RDD family protein [Candidatus Acidoferrum sp.]|nr:RDD family protein [Candidatus Acidoferrum sp.]